MEPTTKILQAMQLCPYKAWQLSKGPVVEYDQNKTEFKPTIKLLSETTAILNNEQPPPFYKIPHCSECHLKNDCYKKLKEGDCISLLAGMTPKTLSKYHSKGITTITQLSYLFKAKRRGSRSQDRRKFSV